MGEIRVKVRLTNAVDDSLAREGLRPVDQVRTYEADAMVDTGAVRSIIPVQVLRHLGVSVRGQQVAEYADGRCEAVDVTGPIIFELQGRDTLEEALVLGNEVLIGQTVLEKLDLFADGQGRRLVPNPAHPDQPVTKVKQLRLFATQRPSQKAEGPWGEAAPVERRTASVRATVRTAY